MANIIYIDFQDGEGHLSFPLLDDVQVTLENEYEALGDLFPSMEKLFGDITSLSTLAKGGVSKGLATFNNLLGFKRWKNTNPLKINTKLLFYTQSKGAYQDVILNMNKFIERATLSLDNEGHVSVPGWSLNEIFKNITPDQREKMKISADTENSLSSRSKLMDIVIPGTVQIYGAYMESIQPQYSKQITSNGYPIWGILDIQFSGTIPATYNNNFNNLPHIVNVGGKNYSVADSTQF